MYRFLADKDTGVLSRPPSELVSSRPKRQRTVDLDDLSIRPIGLQNIGDSCYVNALLQILFLIQPIREIYLHKRWNSSSSSIPTPGSSSSSSSSAPAFESTGRRGVDLPDFILEILAQTEQDSLQGFIDTFHVLVSEIFQSIVAGQAKGIDEVRVSSDKLITLRYETHGTQTQTTMTQESFIEIFGRLLDALNDDPLVRVDTEYARVFGDTLGIEYRNSSGTQTHKILWLIVAADGSMSEVWSLETLLTGPKQTRSCFAMHNEFDIITKTSEYFLVAIERGSVAHGGAVKSGCYAPNYLSIGDTNEVFELIGIVSRMPGFGTSGHYIVRAYYSGKWFYLNDSIVDGNEGCAGLNVFETELVVYRKIPLSQV